MVKKRYFSKPRLLMIRSLEDVQSELEMLGIAPEKGKVLSYEMFTYYLKLEKMALGPAIFLRGLVDTLGGKMLIAEEEHYKKEKIDTLIVGNWSFFKKLSFELSKHPAPFKKLSQELKEAAIPKLLDNNNLILEWNGRKIDFSSRTYIMGVLNVTPDSFSDGGKFFAQESAVKHAFKMAEEGADIIDSGGESSRPGAKGVDTGEELQRVIPVIKSVVKEVDVALSIDTTKARVAEEALAEGAEIVNDISALRFDPEMAPLVAKRKVPVILMHMKGTPQTMQANVYYHNLISEIIEFLEERISFAVESGIERKKIIIDPGIGFGKSIQRDNFTILRNLEEFQCLGRPLMVGPSRKAFLGRLLKLPVEDREDATAGAVAVAVMNGANIIRVHDVKKMKRVVQVVETIKRSEPFCGGQKRD